MRLAFYAVLALLLLPYLLTVLYTVVNPVSTLMVWRTATGQRVERQWVPLARIAPALPLTVVISEDGRFCTHSGVDFTELNNAIEDAEGLEDMRGGSTITQQVAKNLFLWGDAAWSARRWSSRWRCGSTWCCPSAGSWKST